MSMNRILGFLLIATGLAACAQTTKKEWFSEYGTMDVSAPATMQYGAYEDIDTATQHRMAVLLPLSGNAAPVGRAIRSSVEIATMQRAPENLSVTFYDTAENADTAITRALGENPEIIVGPVFANDARMLRAAKPETMPVLSFTSDATAIGDGVMTMALMPTNSIEAIVGEMAADETRKFIIMAPDTESGKIMAGTARRAAEIYNVDLVGLFYYKERDSESIKNTTATASMNAARTAANTRAREILSDILTGERLTAIEKSSLNTQLNKISKSDTLGLVPYDAVLFLGSGDDTKSLASFFRYYGVGARDVRFYGTAVWDGTNIIPDVTMIGAKYAALPEMNAEFANVYEQVSGTVPSRMATFGYDATNMAIGMIYSNKSNAAYLLNPSGYVGVDGLVRLTPYGASQRALRIVQLNGTNTPHTLKAPAANFMAPIYNIEQRHITPAREMALETRGINPNDYINIPPRLHDKYRSKTYGAHMTSTTNTNTRAPVVTILPEDDSDAVITPDFAPITLESVSKTYIDSVEIEE